MHITTARLTVTDVEAASAYFAEVLDLPVVPQGSRTGIVVGSTRLQLEEGPAGDGVHHLAFDIPPETYEKHRDWLSDRVPLLRAADGRTEFEGPPSWNSRSVYFEGPDRMVLELIARRERPRHTDRVPHLASISEVGVAVADVPAAVSDLAAAGLSVFGSSSAEFAPVGDHDGLIIVVRTGRAWLPVFDVTAAQLPVGLELSLGEPHAARTIQLNDQAVVTTRG